MSLEPLDHVSESKTTADELISDSVETSEPQPGDAIASSRPDREPVKIMVTVLVERCSWAQRSESRYNC